jgi:Mrp family chromosome partitioning ATPase
MQTVMGGVAGFILGTILMFGAALPSARVKWSDALGKDAPDLPVMQVLGQDMASRGQAFAHAMDRLRTKVQLVPMSGRRSQTGKGARCLSVLRAGKGEARTLARGLATSFANTDLRVLYVEADAHAAPTDEKGWRDLGIEAAIAPVQEDALFVLPAGRRTAIEAQSSFSSLRRKLALYETDYDVIILHGGAINGSIDAELFASVSDFTLAEVRHNDRKVMTAKSLNAIAERPRHGAAVVFSKARKRDPGLAL